MTCKYCESNEQWSIFDFGEWELRLHTYQFTLGVCILVLKNHKEGFTSLSLKEVSAFHKACRDIETALQKQFQPDWFNYFITNNLERHVHAHIVPRYKTSRIVNNETFLDSTFSSMPRINGQECKPETRNQIMEQIKTALQYGKENSLVKRKISAKRKDRTLIAINSNQNVKCLENSDLNIKDDTRQNTIVSSTGSHLLDFQ